MSIGEVIRLHHVKPIKKMMAGYCPSIVVVKPAIVMQNPISLSNVRINYQMTAGAPCTFVLNHFTIDVLDNELIETRCGRIFYNKQCARDVTNYGKGCSCFLFFQ